MPAMSCLTPLLSHISFRVLLALAAAAAVGCSGSDSGPAGRSGAAQRPNIVLVSIDSLRADHVGCYGYARDTTPFLDQLARRGVRFETAVSTTSWTLPAHAAMLTGLVDVTHGVMDNGKALSRNHVTLAELLADGGYHTAGFFGGPYLHPIFGFGQGFDVYESCMSPGLDLADPRPRPDQHAMSHADITGPRTRTKVRSWADGRAADDDGQPYFLFVHLWDVHYDFTPPPEYAELFTDRAYSGPADGALMSNPAIEPGMSAADRQHVLGLYDAEIRFTDDVLKGIWSDLAERGLTENTLLVVTSDHGEEFFEHGQKGHNKTLFDEVVRVPLVIAWEGEELAAGSVVREQVQIIDLVPTLAFAAGVRHRFATQGRDLGPALVGGSLGAREALLALGIDGAPARALRSSQRKLYRPGPPGTALLEYDLSLDPGERRMLPGSDAARSELRDALEGAKQLRDVLGTRPDTLEIQGALLQELVELGYLGGGDE